MGEQQNTALSRVDSLAQDVRYYSNKTCEDILMLGRALAEARELVPHGSWAAWVENNSAMSYRTSMNAVAIYERFGGNEMAARIGTSKLYKMLSLPSGAEERFLAENDVESMTCRETAEAVQRVREEYDGRLKEERIAREAAERIAQQERAAREAAESTPPKDFQDMLDERDKTIQMQKDALEQAAECGRDALNEAQGLREQNARLLRELEENGELLEEVQRSADQAQEELLNMKSVIAKGDAEREPESDFTLHSFSRAVGQFLSVCSRMPRMGQIFSVMDSRLKNEYRIELETIEEWAKGARAAVDTFAAEGVIHDV